MIKHILGRIFVFSVLSLSITLQCAYPEIVETKDETIIGRAKGLVLESQTPTTIILNLDPSRVDPSQKDAIIKVCKSIEHVKSAKYFLETNTVELIVPPFGGSFETLGNEIKKTLEETLGVAVLECRIR